MSDAGLTRPKSATVLGIINIIFGGSGILGGFLSIGIFSFMNSLFQGLLYEMPSDFFWFMQSLSSFFIIMSVITAVQFAVSAVGLAGGITLLKEKRFAILLTNIYAGLTILMSIVSYVVSLSVTRGILNNKELLSYMSYEDMIMFNILKNIFPGAIGIIGILFASAYPVVLLILLNKPHVRAYYAEKA